MSCTQRVENNISNLSFLINCCWASPAHNVCSGCFHCYTRLVLVYVKSRCPHPNKSRYRCQTQRLHHQNRSVTSIWTRCMWLLKAYEGPWGIGQVQSFLVVFLCAFELSWKRIPNSLHSHSPDATTLLLKCGLLNPTGTDGGRTLLKGGDQIFKMWTGDSKGLHLLPFGVIIMSTLFIFSGHFVARCITTNMWLYSQCAFNPPGRSCEGSPYYLLNAEII